MKVKSSSLSFRALILAQFMGAFNDNAFKIIVSLFAIRVLSSPEAAAGFISLIGMLFIIPFIVFSPVAGYLADRFPKRSIIISMQALEVFNMIMGFFALASGMLWPLCLVLFSLMVQSAFLSPAKYGILPEMLDDKSLSAGNGRIQMWTYIAIIGGTAAGGKLSSVFADNIANSAWVMIGLSLIGFLASLFIGKTNTAINVRPIPKNIFSEAAGSLREIRADKGLFLSMCALAYFQFLGAVFQMNILLYGTHALGLAQMQTSLLLVAVSLGVAAGSGLAGRFSEGKVELGLVPLGAIGLSFFCFLLGLVPGGFKAALTILFFLGLSSGFYIVPLNAFFQKFSPEEKRGKNLAALNIVTSGAVLFAAGFLWVLSAVFKIGPAAIFLILSVLSLSATLYIVRTLPIALVRLLNWTVAHSIYRIRICGDENVPEKGGALLVANHVSFIDAVITLAALKRPVRFIMHEDIYKLPLLNFVCRVIKAIPINPLSGPKSIVQALTTAREAIRSGELVCIFPEGHLSRTGNMLPFQKGFEHIMKDLDAPIIPFYLDNIWGSIFSYSDGKYFWKFPKQAPYPITVVFGKSLPADSRSDKVRVAVQELGAEANIARGLYRRKLHIAFIEEAKKHPFRFCMADSTGMRLTYFEALAGLISLKQTLFPRYRQPKETNEMIGIMLPASCMAAVANGVVYVAGKVPVNLNFTLSSESLVSCISQCRMKMVITSRAFIEKAGMTATDEMVFLEDIRSEISDGRRIWSAVMALILPAWLIKLIYVEGDKRNVDDVATVIFSSGSTGEPKGVMLSHNNISSNIEGLYQIFDIKKNDIVMAALPFFHSFGFTATMCFPVGTGIGVIYHTNPVDAATIGKLTQRFKATMIMGTPTFLSTYVRKCTKEQFASLRLAIVGAEKLKESLASAFKEKFGFIPFEGYGATELSPIASVGFPDFVHKETMERQIGHKAGKVGHPIPGVAVKVVDPDTFGDKQCNEEGLLLVKGANVMKGYLNNPAKTNEVIKDGWYVTGDIAFIDEDGFVKITDRLSRFSKIGGEMVPHIKIEENIMEVLGSVDPVVAVTSVGDDKKGERLVVLHSVDMDVDSVCTQLAAKGLPNLWIPKKDSFFRVDSIPVLGTGKTDLKQVKAAAERMTAAADV
jgi:acyl-[acyl-carrier-protein]-phospholipid O-acyltransferase/long-chain-fatty-acid--[acyl-carrier-protein] ligase